MPEAYSRSELRERYGQATALTGEQVTALLPSLPVEPRPPSTHPYRHLFAYPSAEAAEAYAAMNREHHGHLVHGPFDTQFGPVNVTDLRAPERSNAR